MTRTTRLRATLAAAACLAALCSAACAARVVRFDAVIPPNAPAVSGDQGVRHVCPTQPFVRVESQGPGVVARGAVADLSWEVEGSARLAGYRLSGGGTTNDAPLFETDVPSTGTKRITFDEDMTFVLTARRRFGFLLRLFHMARAAEDKASRVAWEFRVGPQSWPVDGPATCDDGRITAGTRISVSQWDPHLHVHGTAVHRALAPLLAHPGRRLNVWHGSTGPAIFTRDATTSPALDGAPPGGEWRLELDLAEGESCASVGAVPVLSVVLQTACDLE
jgi:hypothetical protein